MKFVSEGDAAEALAFIPPDVLPETFGGAAALLPMDEAVRKFGLAKPVQIDGPGKARATTSLCWQHAGVVALLIPRNHLQRLCGHVQARHQQLQVSRTCASHVVGGKGR